MLKSRRSIAAATPKPALSKPRSSPPAPQNRLISSPSDVSMPSGVADMLLLTIGLPHLLEELSDRDAAPRRLDLDCSAQVSAHAHAKHRWPLLGPGRGVYLRHS